MVPNYLKEITSALSSDDEPNHSLDAIAQAYKTEIGFILFTITSIDTKKDRPVSRLWSTHPHIYPIGGTKELDSDNWSKTVLGLCKTAVCNEPSEFKQLFTDYEEIINLGCGSCLNIPVVVHKEVLGTVNIFHRSQWFTPERIENANALSGLVYAPLLLAQRCFAV